MRFTKLETELIGIRNMTKKVKKYGISSITLDIKLEETKKKLKNSRSYFFRDKPSK